MTEMNEGFVPEEQNNEVTNSETSGFEALVGGVIGGVAGVFSGKTWGYNKALKDAAEATGMDYDDLKAKVKKPKKEKKAGKLHFGFYRDKPAEEVKKEPAQEVQDKGDEPKPAKRKAKKPAAKKAEEKATE